MTCTSVWISWRRHQWFYIRPHVDLQPLSYERRKVSARQQTVDIWHVTAQRRIDGTSEHSGTLRRNQRGIREAGVSLKRQQQGRQTTGVDSCQRQRETAGLDPTQETSNDKMKEVEGRREGTCPTFYLWKFWPPQGRGGGVLFFLRYLIYFFSVTFLFIFCVWVWFL